MPDIENTTEGHEIMQRIRELELRRELRTSQDTKKQKNERSEQFAKTQIGFAGFCEQVMRDERTDDPIILAPIHKSWIDFILWCWAHGLHSCILAPFGHGKTAIFGIALPLWLFGIDPTLRVKLFCANDRLARERLGLVRQYIEESDEYHELFPHVKPHPNKPWSAHELYLDRQTKAKDPSLQAFGAMASAIGGRSDINLFDDLNDAKNTLVEPKRREQVIRNYRSVFMSRLDRISGHASMIATRWHDKDMPGSILDDEDMRNNYGFLVQRISEDFERIDCEYLLGQPKLRRPRTQLEMFLQSKHRKEDLYDETYFVGDSYCSPSPTV